MKNEKQEMKNAKWRRPSVLHFSLPAFHFSFVLKACAGLATIVGASCCARIDRPGPAAATQPYRGPTLPMVEVVQEINRNNRAVPTLWASHDYEAEIVDERTRDRTTLVGDGGLLYRRPAGFRLALNKPGVGTVFEVGSTDAHYWLKLTPPGDATRMYFGEHRHAGKPCVRRIPIQPELVTEVLGVGVIDTDFVKFPAPIMRFNPDADCYMFNWVTPGGGPDGGPRRLVAQREVWYDRRTLLPRKVILSDADGRPLLNALLDGHRPVGEAGDDDARPAAPKVATSYRMFFPETGSKLSVRVREMAFSRGSGARQVPTRAGIAFPGATPDEAGVREVIKLDKDCAD